MIEATITDISYDTTTVDVPAPTPLAPDATTTVTSEFVTVTFSVGSVVGHELSFPPAAIGNRMSIYGLASAEDAILALVRELVFSWSPDLVPADPTSKADVNGGTDDRITVTATVDIADVVASIPTPDQP